MKKAHLFVTLGLLLVTLVGGSFPLGDAKRVCGWETGCPSYCKGHDHSCEYHPCYGPPYASGHCTCYVYQRAVAEGWNPDLIDGLGDALYWAYNAQHRDPPLPVGSYPYPGSIAVRDWWHGDNHYGHVAYMTDVSYTSDGSIQFRVDEMNPCDQDSDGSWPCTHCVRRGSVYHRSPQFSFIYPETEGAALIFPVAESIHPDDDPFILTWYSCNGGPYELDVRIYYSPYS